MAEGITNIAGIEIPSTDPIFLAVVGVHVLLGLACTVTGAVAMVSQKRSGRHPGNGTIYFWCLAGIFLTSTSLAAVRWAEDYHLFVLGALSFAAAYLGRQARRQRWRCSIRLRITGMGASYVLLLIAFYVDNGMQLPVWQELPHFTYWLLPLAVGIPLIVRALLWHPLARQPSSPAQAAWLPQARCRSLGSAGTARSRKNKTRNSRQPEASSGCHSHCSHRRTGRHLSAWSQQLGAGTTDRSQLH